MHRGQEEKERRLTGCISPSQMKAIGVSKMVIGRTRHKSQVLHLTNISHHGEELRRNVAAILQFAIRISCRRYMSFFIARTVS